MYVLINPFNFDAIEIETDDASTNEVVVTFEKETI